MKYAIVGGDMRSVLLAESLSADGHTVHCFANEKGKVHRAVRCSCLVSCLYGADCVVLPVPAERGGILNAPLSTEKKPTEEIITCLVPGQMLFGGVISDKLNSAAADAGVRVFDFMKDESFVLYNAALTAEAAAGLMIHDCDRAVLGSRALILGYGRLGKELSRILSALGCEVTVAARGAVAVSVGMHTINITELENGIDGFDFIINTVPARILSSSALCTASEGAFLMELASAPGGFDAELAQNIGLKTVSAPGLPGRFSPRSSAQYIKEYIYTAVNAGKE